MGKKDKPPRRGQPLYKGQKPFPLGVPISEVPLYTSSQYLHSTYIPTCKSVSSLQRSLNNFIATFNSMYEEAFHHLHCNYGSCDFTYAVYRLGFFSYMNFSEILNVFENGTKVHHLFPTKTKLVLAVSGAFY